MKDINSDKKEYRCPQCKRLIYDRKHKKCGYCGAELPEDLLFTQEEVEKMNKELTELEEQHRKLRIKKENEEKERQRKIRDSGGDGFTPFLP